jgi:hypothetical protein
MIFRESTKSIFFQNIKIKLNSRAWMTPKASVEIFQTLEPKSLERSPVVGDFYGTRIEIWAGFGPVRQLLRPVFSCFHGQKKFFKNILDGENIFGIE